MPDPILLGSAIKGVKGLFTRHKWKKRAQTLLGDLDQLVGDTESSRADFNRLVTETALSWGIKAARFLPPEDGHG